MELFQLELCHDLCWMLEPAGKSGHVIASQIQQQYNFSLPEKVSKMLCLLNSCEVADFWILSCAAGISVIVCWYATSCPIHLAMNGGQLPSVLSWG